MDELIIATAKTVGWLFFCALGLFLIWFVWNQLFRLYRNAIGSKLLAEAIREHRKLHPERYRHFDALASDE